MVGYCLLKGQNAALLPDLSNQLIVRDKAVVEQLPLLSLSRSNGCSVQTSPATRTNRNYFEVRSLQIVSFSTHKISWIVIYSKLYLDIFLLP